MTIVLAMFSKNTLVFHWFVIGFSQTARKCVIQAISPSNGRGGTCRQGGGRDGAGGGGERARAEQAADQTCSEHGLRGDDYTVLGVSRFSCSRKSLKSAFRKASLKYHPDKYTGTKECAEMHFKRLSSAHDRLLTVCT